MENDKYTCVVCGETYEKEISDEEAAENLKEEFPGFDPEDCAIVCDPCYQKLFG